MTEPTPARVYDENDLLDFTAVGDYLNKAVAYVLRTANGPRPDAWRELSAEKLADAISSYILAGISVHLSRNTVEMGLRVARAEMARLKAEESRIREGDRVRTPDGDGFVFAATADVAHVTLDGQSRNATFPLAFLVRIGA